MQEVADALTTTRAVARLRGKTTSFVGGVVASVGTMRLLFFLAMQAFRLAVASLLCYGGAYFIGHTIALSDLILNCIALEVRSSFCRASCVGVVGSIVPGGIALYDQHARVVCLAVGPARAAGEATPHTADPRGMPVMSRDRTVYAARVGAWECAFHAVRGRGDQLHTKCTLHGGRPGGAVRRPVRCVRAR